MTLAAEQEKQKWPFDPLQPGDHEPVRIPEDHPSKQPKPGMGMRHGSV